MVSLWLLFVLGVSSINGETCDVVNDPDVKFFDLRLPEIEVPDDITTYVCQQFKVPDDDVYHAVAFEPLIDNHEVMHHMLLFGCPMDIGQMEPHQCGPIDNRCPSWLAQWTMGVKGQVCAHPGTGVRFGKGSFEFMALQIHWNNALKATNMSDTSGMRIYYTRKLRQYDTGNVQVGQTDLEIPPGVTNLRQAGGCSGNCTKNLLPYSIYLTRTYIHMHYLGVRGLFEVYRDGNVVQTIAEDPEYQYHLSPIHVHNKPVEIKPGDEIRLTCYFDTKTGDKLRDHTVYYGEGSDSEMCFAFVTYYPRVESLDQCIQFADYDVCGPTGGSSYGECRFTEFSMAARQQLIPDITENCRNMTKVKDCESACAKSLQAFHDQPCMKGRLGAHARRTILSQIDEWKWIEKLSVDHQC